MIRQWSLGTGRRSLPSPPATPQNAMLTFACND